MKSPFRTSLLALCVSATLLLPGVASAGIEEAEAAYQNKDVGKALKEFKPLAIQGNVDAQFMLAYMYNKGQGVSQDYKEGAKWNRLAAAQGDAFAQANLGLMYHSGLGVSQDYMEALKWYRLAAAQGHVGAQNNLGLMYTNGNGVFSSHVVGYALYNISAAGDSADATVNRTDLLKSMNSKDINAGQNLTRELAKPGNFLKALDNYVKKPIVRER